MKTMLATLVALIVVSATATGCAVQAATEATGSSNEALTTCSVHSATTDQPGLVALGCGAIDYQYVPYMGSYATYTTFLCPNTPDVATAAMILHGNLGNAATPPCAPALPPGQVYLVLIPSSQDSTCKKNCTVDPGPGSSI